MSARKDVDFLIRERSAHWEPTGIRALAAVETFLLLLMVLFLLSIVYLWLS